jgi:hypothetical protein
MATDGGASGLAEAAAHLERAAERLEGLLEADGGWSAAGLAEAARAYLEALDQLLARVDGLTATEADHLPPDLAERIREPFRRHDRIQARLLHAHQAIADSLPQLRRQRNTLDAYAGPDPSGGGFLDHQG